METGIYKIGLINNSGKSLYARVENRNCRKQLFFNLHPGKISYVVRDTEQAYVTFSADSPFDKTSKTFQVSNNANYLIDSEINLSPVGNGKAMLSDKHFDELTKYEEDLALRNSLLITEIWGIEFPQGEEPVDAILVRMQKKAFGTLRKELLYPITTPGVQPSRFMREPGEFKLEIFLSMYSRHKGLVYKIESGKRYKLNYQKQLVNLETNSVLEPLKEKFFSDTINDEMLNIDYNNPEQFKNIVYFENQIPVFADGENFSDHYFPPEERIVSSRDANGNHVKSHFNLMDVFNDGDFDEINNQKTEFDGLVTKCPDLINFMRPAEIYEGEYYLFRNGIEPGDVKQGSVGDCWAISAIAALATRPELIMNIFQTKQKNPKGFYELFYYDANGNKKLMFVDDHMLCFDGKPHFSKSDDREIWAMLMEKSLAKYEGGYSNLVGGLLENALKFWTGKKCTTYKQENFNENWYYLHNAIKSKFIVCAGTLNKQGKTDQDELNGIYYGHAYSILDVKHYTESGHDLKMVLLRNPWGNKEWQGDYSDDSLLWNDELKKFFNYHLVTTDNGIFWMKFEDFSKYFGSFTICECAEV